MARRWAIKSPDNLLLEDVDDFLCCYGVLTGRTHILDAFPAEVMRLLSTSPRSSEELAGAIAAQVGDADASQWLESVVPVLEGLCESQLVEPVPE